MRNPVSNNKVEARKMAQQLQAQTILENPSSVPGTKLGGSELPVTPALKDPMPSSDLYGHYIHVHIPTRTYQNPHIHTIKNKMENK